MKYIILIIVFLNSLLLYSQVPNNDPIYSYVLDTQDDFIGNSLNTNLWYSTPNNTWGLETYSANNVTVSNGVLTLKCEEVVAGNSYLSGGIQGRNSHLYSYGYFEIESKLPANGSRGPWGGFWMHTGAGGWDEIDIMEPNGCDTEIGTQIRTGNFATLNGVQKWSGEKIIYNLPNLSANFHKYSCIWTPTSVEYFVDGIKVHEVFDRATIPTHPMSMFLTFQVDKFGCKPIDSSTWPAYWQYKKFKYYKLNIAECENGIYADNFNFLNNSNTIKEYYSLGNSTIPNNSNIFLHAIEYIELRPGFGVPLGSTLTAIVHGTCPE